MVKFFLKNQKPQSLPKQFQKSSFNNKQQSNHRFNNKSNDKPHNRSNNKQDKSNKSKNKKVLDYRIVLWKKLYHLIKSQHSIMMQKSIRKIKQTKSKIQSRQNQSINNNNQQQQNKDNKKGKNNDKKDDKQLIQKINILKKDLTNLDTKYQSLKSIKKTELKHITLYILLQILKIQSLEKVLQKAKLQATLDLTKLKSQIQSNQSIKKFIQKLTGLTVYQQQLEQCAQLVDVVQQKKLQRKSKLKQRKTRKYQKQHGIIKQHQLSQSENQDKSINQQISENDNQQSNQNSQDQQIQLKKPLHHKKNKNLTIKVEVKHENHKSQQKSFNNKRQQRSSSKPHFSTKQTFPKRNFNDKQKPIRKQRTQFRKTGRNKVKFEKQQKKHHFRSQDNKDNQSKNNSKENRPKKGTRPFAFSKQQAHPSWQAKQQLKQQVFIKPFQGKKILL